jgi:hypothetical protein
LVFYIYFHNTLNAPEKSGKMGHFWVMDLTLNMLLYGLHCGDPIGYADIYNPYWKSHLYGFGRLGSGGK